jgi:hypothetical protein
MPESPEFPLDLKSIINDCILALFWPKKDIIKFLDESGAQATDLSVVRAPSSELKRHEIVSDVFYRLGRRSDRGFMTFHRMISRLNEWTYFDTYWFDKLAKLDRTHADARLAELRRMLAVRNATTVAQKAAATKSAEMHDSNQTLTELLNEFRQLAKGGIKPQQRGYEFEKLLRRLFDQQGIPMSEHFKLKGEEIDGSFKFEGENYITEAKWQEASVSTEALYKFAMKADGKMYGRGVFISVNAYSREGLPAMVTGKHIKTILIDGEDLVLVMEGQINLTDMLDVKIRAAQLRGEVYVHPLTSKSKV